MGAAESAARSSPRGGKVHLGELRHLVGGRRPKPRRIRRSPRCFATAKPARTLRDVVDRVGQYWRAAAFGAIVELVLNVAGGEAKVEMHRLRVRDPQAHGRRSRRRAIGGGATEGGAGGTKPGTSTAQAALRERLTELQATGREARRAGGGDGRRGVEKKRKPALCALLDCEPTPILQDQRGALCCSPPRSRSNMALRAGGSDLQATTAAIASGSRRARIGRRRRRRDLAVVRQEPVSPRRVRASLRRRGLVDALFASNQVPGARPGGAVRASSRSALRDTHGDAAHGAVLGRVGGEAAQGAEPAPLATTASRSEE